MQHYQNVSGALMKAFLIWSKSKTNAGNSTSAKLALLAAVAIADECGHDDINKCIILIVSSIYRDICVIIMDAGGDVERARPYAQSRNDLLDEYRTQSISMKLPEINPMEIIEALAYIACYLSLSTISMSKEKVMSWLSKQKKEYPTFTVIWVKKLSA